MGEWFTSFVLDVLRGWIGSSEGGQLKAMTEDQIEELQSMENRHEMERQALMRRIFHACTT